MKLPKLDKIGLSASFKGGFLFSKIIKTVLILKIYNLFILNQNMKPNHSFF
jgi:hypothetical protein